MSLRLRLTPRALAEAKRIKTWWRRKRLSAPDLFEDELDATLERALSNPGLGLVYHDANLDVPVYRVLMPRTSHHVFYAVHGGDLVVLSVWGAVKERGPKL
jgi:plasmid stabilization system protein ParE